METFLHSLVLVTLAEIGDKTQILSVLLAAKYKRFWPICLGILAATLINHALAAALGSWLAEFVQSSWLQIITGVAFIAIGLWVLIPDKAPLTKEFKYGAFITSTIAFFIAEMGDKTQLATITLGAELKPLWQVISGTTAGMLMANIPAILLGENILKVVPLKTVRIIASLLFIGFGVWGLWSVYSAG